MVTFNGYTADEILLLPDDVLRTHVVSGAPMVVRIGTADVLGRFWIEGASLVLELGHIDGGGEGVLPAIAVLAQRFASGRRLDTVDWRVHAVNCSRPNYKLRAVLKRRGFEIADVAGAGLCYRKVHAVRRSRPSKVDSAGAPTEW